jgi:hypothetical protein
VHDRLQRLSVRLECYLMAAADLRSDRRERQATDPQLQNLTLPLGRPLPDLRTRRPLLCRRAWRATRPTGLSWHFAFRPQLKREEFAFTDVQTLCRLD